MQVLGLKVVTTIICLKAKGSTFSGEDVVTAIIRPKVNSSTLSGKDVTLGSAKTGLVSNQPCPASAQLELLKTSTSYVGSQPSNLWTRTCYTKPNT